PSSVPFLVLLHRATAPALLIISRREWARITAGFVRAAIRGRIEGPDERLAMLLALGTLPGGAIGFFVVQPIATRLFASPRLAAAMLLVNGGILLGAEVLRRRSERAGASREEQEDAFKEVSQIGIGAVAL